MYINCQALEPCQIDRIIATTKPQPPTPNQMQNADASGAQVRADHANSNPTNQTPNRLLFYQSQWTAHFALVCGFSTKLFPSTSKSSCLKNKVQRSTCGGKDHSKPPPAVCLLLLWRPLRKCAGREGEFRALKLRAARGRGVRGVQGGCG
jgi:hypothetical protein